MGGLLLEKKMSHLQFYCLYVARNGKLGVDFIWSFFLLPVLMLAVLHCKG